jgi:ribokinase
VRLAVVGHVEWVDFVLAGRLPSSGEIAAAEAAWEAAAGGGAMAAYALKALTGEATFCCAIGDDARAQATVADLRAAGLDVRAAERDRPQRRTLTWLTADHERTITTLGPPLEPRGADLPDLSGFDGVVLFDGDAAAARAARAARTMVATARTRAALLEAGVSVDALVGSANDATEPVDDALLAVARPRWVVETDGARGGRWRAGWEDPARPGAESPVCDVAATEARSGRWSAAPLPGEPLDAFGCGDAFAASLMAALADGRSIEAACALGARVGATVLCERAPAVGDLAPLWAP